MRELLNDFLIWLKKPDPDTILIKLWGRKRDRDEVIKDIEAKQRTEEERQKIEKQAYLLWEADGKPEGRDDYYWILATDKVKGRNLPTLYKPYYFLEKCILEPIDAWITKQAFFTILGGLGNLALVVAVVSFVFGENVRRNNEVFAAWTTITTAYEQPGSGGRVRALEFLNSRPLRFPWIWGTIDFFLDGKECKRKLVFGRRWKRESLTGLSTPKAYLVEINLCRANLDRANLQDADLFKANLQNASLLRANLQNAILIEANLQNAILIEANLQSTSLSGANLQGAFLTEAKLQSTRLSGANLQNASLLGANFQNSSLLRANFQNADLWGANFQNASLLRANLQNVNLFVTNFQNADLREAKLQKANLYRANIQNADLFEANLQEAILIETKNLTHKQIKSTCFWDRAIYKGKWNGEKETFVALESDNTKFIEELKNDTASDPDKPIDCSYWEKGN